MYKFRIEKKLEKILAKLERKNQELYLQIKKKIGEIVNSENIEHYKNLSHDLKEFKRVHIGHFVLIFRFNVKDRLIYFEDFDHHDNIYKKKF
ncbi:addiction module toxin RelE [Candidatus Pacearchaeota archaeon]|nr:addiction module toxin RelE [Candidatus Pacearchaeota archaeon]